MFKKCLYVFLFIVASISLTFADTPCLNFDGTDDYLNVGTVTTDFTTGITIEAHVYYDGFNFWSRIIDFGNGPGNNNILLANSETTNSLVYETYNGPASSGKITAYGILTTNTWMHIAVTQDNFGNVIIYKDGVQVGSGTCNVPNSITRNNCYLARSNWSGDGYFDGKLQDIRVWDIVRTPEQISENMNSRLIGDEAGLEFYYKLDESSGQIAYDSASGQDAFLGETALSDSGDPIWEISDQTLPVELASFTVAATSNNNAQISWTTSSETNILGYDIFRSESEDMNYALRLNSTLINPTNMVHDSYYTYCDNETEVETSYFYWLKVNELNNEFSYFGPIGLKIEINNDTPGIEIPDHSVLRDIYPNPFNPSTTIQFFLEDEKDVSINIFNIKGQKVKNLVQRSFSSGLNDIVWNGTDNSNVDCTSGMYFVVLKTDNKKFTKSIVLMK